jgi:hypothetical protein
MMPGPAVNGNHRILMTGDEIERLMLMTMQLDRYEAQVIPGLRERVRDLTQALEAIVAAAQDGSPCARQDALEAGRQALAG